MENENVIEIYLDRYYTREWDNKKICRICDRPINGSISEHYKQVHKNIYDDMLKQIDEIKKILESNEKKA